MSRHFTVTAGLVATISMIATGAGFISGCEPPTHDDEQAPQAVAQEAEASSTPADEYSSSPVAEEGSTPVDEEPSLPSDEEPSSPSDEDLPPSSADAEEVAEAEGEDEDDEQEPETSESEQRSDKLPRLSDDEINDVIEEQFGDIRRCVLRGLDDRQPGAVESWYVDFTIDTDGEVDADTFSVKENAEEDVTEADVGRCLQEIFVELQFSSLPNRRGVLYPLYVR